jgi:hypothetical protein
MMQKIFGTTLAIALVTCGQSTGWAAGDACTLIPEPVALFGQPVTVKQSKAPTGVISCEWHSAKGQICGSITVFGAGWNEIADVRLNYNAMLTSLGAFGQPYDVRGIGDEARAVDGGMFGAQLAFRTSKAAVLAASACGSETISNPTLVEKVARAIAPRL